MLHHPKIEIILEWSKNLVFWVRNGGGVVHVRASRVRTKANNLQDPLVVTTRSQDNDANTRRAKRKIFVQPKFKISTICMRILPPTQYWNAIDKILRRGEPAFFIREGSPRINIG